METTHQTKNTINSTGNEVFPVFINDTTLVFSSDGLQTSGKGLDIYKTTYKKENGQSQFCWMRLLIQWQTIMVCVAMII